MFYPVCYKAILDPLFVTLAVPPTHTQVVAYDFGIKHNILRRLASYGCRITVVPATYPAADVLKMNPDGVFFSNGPVSRYFWILYFWTLLDNSINTQMACSSLMGR
jgi:hypothetical protein